VGGQSLSLRTGSLKPQGSGTTKPDSPDALMDSNATITARDKRRTAGIVAPASPPLTIVNAVYPRPGAEILLTGTDRSGREQVVLAVQQHGAGRVVAFTPQDSWVWVMHAKVDSPAQEKFWRALLLWLVAGVS
jgi:uncharacterized membrane protein